jgi:hypothetical protein
MIAVLCDSLNWHVLSSIFRSAAARIASGVPSELLPLMQAS